MLQYEDIADEHGGTLDPRLNRALDPRQALADAQVILGCDNGQTSTPFLLYGREFMEKAGGHVRPGMRILVISLDAKNTQTRELEKMLAIVKAIKGRHDYPWIENDAESEGVGGSE